MIGNMHTITGRYSERRLVCKAQIGLDPWSQAPRLTLPVCYCYTRRGMRHRHGRCNENCDRDDVQDFVKQRGFNGDTTYSNWKSYVIIHVLLKIRFWKHRFDNNQRSSWIKESIANNTQCDLKTESNTCQPWFREIIHKASSLSVTQPTTFLLYYPSPIWYNCLQRFRIFFFFLCAILS